jgi:hypothetical protein
MRRGRFRHVVDISLLKSVRPDLLAAFLRPFGADLSAAGLALQDAPSAAWLEELGAMLNRDAPELPAALQADLVDIAELATPVGHEQIMALADELGIAIVSAGDPMIPLEDLAFLVYLQQRDLFRAVRSHIKSFERRLFTEHDGHQRRISATHGSAAARAAILKDRLVSWLQKRNRTGACLVRADELDDQIVFSIAHGAAPTRAPEASEFAPMRPGRVPEQHDIIVFDKHQDRLSISALLPTERELYRTLFGFVLFLDEQYFRVVRLYHSRPLRERGSAALDVTDIEGLERVSLKRLSFVSRDRHRSKMEVASEDLRDWLDRRKTKMLLRQRSIGSWTLGFRLRHHTSALDVDV